MSNAPAGWQLPKTDWTPVDGVADADFNRLEGNIAAIESGDRTLDPAMTPAGNIGSLRQILSWFANRLQAVTGAANWWGAPATTLAIAKVHQDAQAPHPGHLNRGTANNDVQQVMALMLMTDTRSVVPTAWNTANKPTSIEIRNGNAVIGTIGISYNGDNRPTQMVVAAGGKTVTYTITWTGDRWDGTTKAVV